MAATILTVSQNIGKTMVYIIVGYWFVIIGWLVSRHYARRAREEKERRGNPNGVQ